MVLYEAPLESSTKKSYHYRDNIDHMQRAADPSRLLFTHKIYFGRILARQRLKDNSHRSGDLYAKRDF